MAELKEEQRDRLDEDSFAFPKKRKEPRKFGPEPKAKDVAPEQGETAGDEQQPEGEA